MPALAYVLVSHFQFQEMSFDLSGRNYMPNYSSRTKQ